MLITRRIFFSRFAVRSAGWAFELKRRSGSPTGRRLQLSAKEQPCQRAEDEEAHRDSRADDHEKREENADDEKPVAPFWNRRAEAVVLNDLVIARVRLEPEGESVAHHRDDADEFIGQNVERHPREKHFRHAKPKRLDQRERRDER